jgi:glycosyltransferase involved in cell wall biosynthesis
MAGSGDLLGATMMKARELGVSDRVVFPGFLRGRDVDRVYRMADVYVMPSVSEPFGLVALEAISHGVPTIVSRQSGVAEVLENVLKVDYWDVQGMADLISTVLTEPGLQTWLRENGRCDLDKLSWDASARQCLEVYRAVL